MRSLCHSLISTPWMGGLLLLLASLSLIDSTWAKDTQYVQVTDANGLTVALPDDRKPSLYTQKFGDCLGGNSLINVTRFDAAYYQDNMTVLFHLEGNTNVKNESIMSNRPNGSCWCDITNSAYSVHWSLCLWPVEIYVDLQPMQCANIQVCTLTPTGRTWLIIIACAP